MSRNSTLSSTAQCSEVAKNRAGTSPAKQAIKKRTAKQFWHIINVQKINQLEHILWENNLPTAHKGFMVTQFVALITKSC